MSDRLDKARRAFDDAVTADAESNGWRDLERKVFKLLDIAQTQAAIASAEALETLVTNTGSRRKITGQITKPRGS